MSHNMSDSSLLCLYSSETCDRKLPEAQTLAAEGNLDGAMEMLMGLEKQTRSG